MSSLLHLNAVITSYIDYYCLVCDIHIRSEVDAHSHIEKFTHQKNLQSTSHVDKYKDDYIRKIKKIYFCECCNKLFTTLSKVGLHVDEGQHNDNKEGVFLKRVGDNIVVFDDIILSETAWHGLIDNTCFICNEEIEDDIAHKKESAHILNLIQSKTEFGAFKYVYRKVDENSIQCLICNVILTLNSLRSHFDDLKHKTCYANCQKKFISNIVSGTKASSQSPAKEAAKQTKASEPSTSWCKSGFLNKPASKQTETNVKAVEKPKEVSEKPEICTVEMDNAISTKLNAPNYIINTGPISTCLLCDWIIETNFVQHCMGIHHQTLLKKHKQRLENKRDANEATPTKTAVDSASASKEVKQNPTQDLTDSSMFTKASESGVINSETVDPAKKPAKNTEDKKPNEPKPKKNKKTISQETDEEIVKFAKENDLVYYPNSNKVQCLVCNIKIPTANMKKHVLTATHKNNFLKNVEKPALIRKPMKNVMKSVNMITHMGFHDFVLNRELVINIASFMMIMETDECRCELCDEVLAHEAINSHILTKSHKDRFLEAMVLTSFEDEFIREARPDVFHCGFCNVIIEELEQLESHLTRASHVEARNNASWRLLQYSRLPDDHGTVFPNAFDALNGLPSLDILD